jgi:hypothetical protein
MEEDNPDAKAWATVDALMLLSSLFGSTKILADRNMRSAAQAAYEVAMGEVSEGEYLARYGEKISSVRLGDEPATTDKGQEEDERYMSQYAR